MLSEIKSVRKKEYSGVRELIDGFGEVLQSSQLVDFVPISDIPNERTIRFYLTEGLLPRPEKGRRQSLPFEYLHLITLFVIKKLQAKGLSNSVIKKLISNKGIRGLEKLLDERIEVFTDRASLNSFIKASGKQAGEEVVEVQDTVARNEYLVTQKGDVPSYPKSERPVKPSISRANIVTWSRIEIGEGLELHANSNFRLPVTASERQSLLRTIEIAIFKLKS